MTYLNIPKHIVFVRLTTGFSLNMPLNSGLRLPRRRRYFGNSTQRGRFSVSNYDFQDMRVLICDDSRHIRALVRTCLAAFGIKDIEEAADADASLEVLKETNPDLVITDWNMPPTSGLAFVEKIRRSGEAPNPYVPIIMLTGHTEVEKVKIARDAGVSSFLAKPVSAHSLYKRLVSLVEDQRLYVRSNDFFGPDRRFKSLQEQQGPERRSL